MNTTIHHLLLGGNCIKSKPDMAVESAGLLMFRRNKATKEVFLVHPGGPFFRNKDEGWWGIPKGLPHPGEDLLEAAKREFYEETGIVPTGPFIPLGSIKQKGGKTVHGWAFEGDWDPEIGISSNFFNIEWPPKSGKTLDFPEVDQALWLSLEKAEQKINAQQKVFLKRFEEIAGPD